MNDPALNELAQFERIRQTAAVTRLETAEYRAVGASLPLGDEGLDRLLTYLVKKRSKRAFMPVILSALDAGRRVDAGHLEGAAALMHEDMLIPSIALKCAGDVDTALLAAVNTGALNSLTKATCLLTAAWWRCDKRPAATWDDIEADLRELRLLPDKAPKTDLVIAALALFLADTGRPLLWPELAESASGGLRRKARIHLHNVREYAGRPILAPLEDMERSRPKKPGLRPRKAGGGKLGRNDPCWCGSGRKYKGCCLAAPLSQTAGAP